MVRALYLIGIVALSTVAGTARADEPTNVAREPMGEAKALFERGASAYRAGDYQRAVEHFRRADRLAPRAALSFNMARAHEKLGQRALAAAEYREYLRREPDAANASWVHERIEALEPTEPEPEPARLAMAEPPEVVVTDRPGDDARSPPGASTSSSTPSSPSLLPAPLPWITLGTGGALLIAAGALELSRRDAESDARSAPSQIEHAEELSVMQERTTAARICAGVGGALLVTGGVLLAVQLGHSTSSVRASASCTSEGCTGKLGGRF